MSKLWGEKTFHQAFEIGLLLKAVFAIAEIAGGIGAYFVTPQSLIQIANFISGHELAENPRDFIANYLQHAAHQFSMSTRHFVAVYLLAHGIVKLWLIAGLLRKRLWYYPVAIAVFGLFVFYQLYRYTLTHSIFLLLITAIDLVVIALTWYEFGRLRRHYMV